MGRNEISIFKKWGWEIGKNEQVFQLSSNPMIAIKKVLLWKFTQK